MGQVISRVPIPESNGTYERVTFDNGAVMSLPVQKQPQPNASIMPPTQPEPIQSTQPQPQAQPAQVPQGPAQEPQRADPMTPYGIPLSTVLGIAQRGKYVVGRPGYDPQAVKNSQVEVPVQTQRQTTGAQPFDEEAVWEIQKKEREAQALKSSADIMQAENNAHIQQIAAGELRDIHQQRAAQQKQREDWYNTRMSALSDEAHGVANQQINPNRVFENMGTAQKIALALSAGLTGYATQGRSGTELLERMIQRDMHAQEEQIRRKQGNVDNALSRLSREWGSIEAGRAALEVQQLEVAKQKVMALGAQVGTNVAKRNALAQAKQIEALQAQQFMTLQNAAAGQTTETTVSQMQTPVKAIAGGRRALTPEEMNKAIANEQALRKTGVEIGGGELKNEEQALKNSGAIVDENTRRHQDSVASRQEHLGNGLSELASLRTATDKVMSKGGITEDAEGRAKHGDIPGAGWQYSLASRIPFIGEDVADLAANVSGQDAMTVRRQVAEMLTYKIKEASGAAFSEREAQRHARSLGDALVAGEDAFSQALVDFRHALDAKERDLKAGAGREATESFERDREHFRERDESARHGVKGAYRGTPQ